jgi:hypothetical protein
LWSSGDNAVARRIKTKTMNQELLILVSLFIIYGFAQILFFPYIKAVVERNLDKPKMIPVIYEKIMGNGDKFYYCYLKTRVVWFHALIISYDTWKITQVEGSENSYFLSIYGERTHSFKSKELAIETLKQCISDKYKNDKNNEIISYKKLEIEIPL